MRIVARIVFALAVAWTVSACTATLNEMGVATDDLRKKSIGR